MPAPGPVRGSDQWIQDFIDHPDIITFSDMMEYPRLLRAYVKNVGRVRLRQHEKIPDTQYPEKGKPGYLNPRQVLKSTRRSMTCHPNWPFLRSGAVNWAVDKCKDLGIYPVRIKTDSLPAHIRNQGFDNFEKTINTFHACYCYAQSYVRSSDMTRLTLLYLHLGKGVFKHKPCKTIPILHKKLQTGIHRFTNIDKIEKHWATFLDLVTNSTVDLTIFLDDKGLGKVPMEYLIAVEEGIRNFAQDKAAMGTHAFDNAESYYAVSMWRKRESYIAVCRYLKGVSGYLKYIGYDWADYQMRGLLQKTFDARHAPYTNGEKKLSGLPDPSSWSDVKPKKKSRRRSRNKHVVSQPKNVSSDSENSDAEYIYDSDEDEWVKIK